MGWLLVMSVIIYCTADFPCGHFYANKGMEFCFPGPPGKSLLEWRLLPLCCCYSEPFCKCFYRLGLLIFCFSELLSPGVKNKNFKCHRTYRLFAGKSICITLFPC